MALDFHADLILVIQEGAVSNYYEFILPVEMSEIYDSEDSGARNQSSTYQVLFLFCFLELKSQASFCYC